MPQIILGSESQERRTIFSEYKIQPLHVCASHFDEASVMESDFKGHLDDFAIAIARGKLDHLLKNKDSVNLGAEHHLIVTADTVVDCAGRSYAKAKSAMEAHAWFQNEFCGKRVSVHTAVAWSDFSQRDAFVESVGLDFTVFDDQTLERYLEAVGKRITCIAGAIDIRKAMECGIVRKKFTSDEVEAMRGFPMQKFLSKINATDERQLEE